MLRRSKPRRMLRTRLPWQPALTPAASDPTPKLQTACQHAHAHTLASGVSCSVTFAPADLVQCTIVGKRESRNLFIGTKDSFLTTPTSTSFVGQTHPDQHQDQTQRSLHGVATSKAGRKCKIRKKERCFTKYLSSLTKAKLNCSHVATPFATSKHWKSLIHNLNSNRDSSTLAISPQPVIR